MKSTLENPQWLKEKEKIENSLRFDLNDVYSHLGEVKQAIDDVKVFKKFGKCNYIDKIIWLIYSGVMNFCQTDKVKSIPISEKFIENVKGILYNEIQIHLSHITGDIIGYSHSYCNLRIRENKYKKTKKEVDDFIKTVIKFNEIDTAALEQKKQECIDELFEDLAGDNVLIFDDGLKTEDIFIHDDYLFDSLDEQETKNICDYVLNDIDQNDALFEDLPNQNL